jgi:hypothetical protein
MAFYMEHLHSVLLVLGCSRLIEQVETVSHPL